MTTAGVGSVDADATISSLRETKERIDQALIDAATHAAGVGARAASAMAPRKTGRLGGSVRSQAGAPGRRVTAVAYVVAGGATASWAGPVHFGWPARRQSPNPFIYRALDRSEEPIYRNFDAAIKKAIEASKQG